MFAATRLISKLTWSRGATPRRLFDRRALPAYLLILAAAWIVALAVASSAFDYDRALFTAIVRDTGIVLLFAYAARWIGFPKIAGAVEQVMLLYLSAITLAFCSIIFATTAAPMSDPWLRAADITLFAVDRTRVLTDFNLSREAIGLWRIAYNSLSFAPPLALVLLTLRGQRRQAWSLLTALIASAFASIACVAIVPAYGTPPFPYEFVAVFDGVRDGSLRTLDESVVTGIITFPSMHAAHATILAIAFSWLGRWAAPLVVLSVAMFISAFVVGGHYLVDLAAGGVVGLAALAIAQHPISVPRQLRQLLLSKVRARA